MRLRISHTTRYNFEGTPAYGVQQVRLTPKSRKGQTVLDWSLSIDGGKSEADYVDHNGNVTHLVRLEDGVQTLSLESAGEVEITLTDGVIGPHMSAVPIWYFQRQTPRTRPGQNMRALLENFEFDAHDAIASLHGLSRHILGSVSYVTGQTESGTTGEEATALGAGVCQDHAHIFLGCVRTLGLPARYVSGYLMMLDRIEQEAAHAWAEVWIEPLGWVGFDVSNQLSPDQTYVRVAMGLDYSEAAPISGLTYGGARESVSVDLKVAQQ